MNISLTVNGKMYRAEVEPRLLLVDFLRDTLGLTGTKSGCDTGECGACTVLLNGASVKSCLLLAVQADGAEVTTIEGLAQQGKLNPVQEAFWENHATQDGYATPGTIMAMTDLLGRNPTATEAEIRVALDGNLDRITGYQNIVRAVQAASEKLRGKQPAQPESAVAPENMVGAGINPVEAPPLLRGEGQFVGDITLPGMTHVAILHSPYAHAKITSIDPSAASAMPGVIRVFTGADTAHIMPLPVVWIPPGVESHYPPHPSGMLPGSQTVLAKDMVRYIGEQIAAVVAETRQQAYDALDKINVTYEPLPFVLDAEEALKDGAPQIHDAAPKNLLTHYPIGDKAGADKAIADAEVVIEKRFRVQRMMHNPIETRGSVAQYDPRTEDYTLWTNTQMPHANRLLISQYVLGIPYNKLRVIVPHVGGSQGSKGYVYVDAPLMLFISKEVGRPVKWVDTRWGLARTTVQSRGQIQDVTLAGRKDGKITALSCTAYSTVGAYPVMNAPGKPMHLIGRSITGAYAIEHPFYEVYLAYTNTVQIGPMRGAGRAEAIFMIERMVDLFALEIGMDPAEVRRKNMVAPNQFPYNNKLGFTYDSGNYVAALDKVLAKIDYRNMAARKAEARKRGKRLGVGIGSYVTIGGVGPSPQMRDLGLIGGTWGSTYLMVQPTGEVMIRTGALMHGQSQQTTFAQIAAQELGIGVDKIKVLPADTLGSPYGQGSYGSRSLSVEGSAVHQAARKIVEKVRKFAAYVFKTPEEQIEYAGGKVFIKGMPEKGMTLQQIAFMLWLNWDVPEGMEPCLEVITYFDPKEFNFPYGSHAAMVEIDEKTGQIDLVRYATVDDYGNVINPKVVDGQTHGNIALGIGQALLEAAVYDQNGQIATDSLSKYPLPKASQMPTFEIERTVTPTATNPLGAKGAGDVSNPPVAPAIVNAICDALSDLGITHIETPVTPEKVWRAMRDAQVAKGGDAR